MILDDQWTAKVVIYPLLCGSFGQCVAVTQIVDLYVLDVVTVLLIGLAVDCGDRVGRRRLDDGGVWHLGSVSSVATAGGGTATRTERMGGTSTCWMPFFA